MTTMMKYIVRHNSKATGELVKKVAYVGFDGEHSWEICNRLARENPYDCVYMEFKKLETKTGGLYA